MHRYYKFRTRYGVYSIYDVNVDYRVEGYSIIYDVTMPTTLIII